jgi:hypothetical protein
LKIMVLRIAIAAVLLAAGDVCRRAAAIEARLADTVERLTTMTASVTPAAYDEVADMLSFVTPIPVIGDRLLEQLRDARARAAYWNGDYTPTSEPPAATGGLSAEPAPMSPARLFLSANASYRRTRQTRRDRAGLLRGLDEVMKGYRDVLDADPDHTGAAYNFEYVARLRTLLARGQPTEQIAPDGPPSMQGEEGDPPQGTKPPEFNVIVPMRPDERQEQFDAGSGGSTRRKG